jgi:hypothetical protein
VKKKTLSYSDSISLFPASLRIIDKTTGLAEITCHVMPEDETYKVEVRLDRDPAAPGRFSGGIKGLMYQVRAKLMPLRAPLVRAKLKAKADGVKNASTRWRCEKEKTEPLRKELRAWFEKHCRENPLHRYSQVVTVGMDKFQLSRIPTGRYSHPERNHRAFFRTSSSEVPRSFAFATP